MPQSTLGFPWTCIRIVRAAAVSLTAVFLSGCQPAANYDLYSAKPGKPVPGLSWEQERFFNQGKETFEHEFGVHEGLGPTFNANSCYQCHGKPDAAGMQGQELDADAFIRFGRLRKKDSFKSIAEAKVGTDIYNFVAPSNGLVQRRSITDEFGFPDGCDIEPLAVPLGMEFVSKRQAPQLLGAGLINAIDEQSIIRNLFKQADKGGDLVGRTNVVENPLTQRQEIGRFGWKAQQSSLFLGVADQMDLGLGVTTEVQNTIGSITGNVQFPQCARKYLPKEPNDDGLRWLQLTNFLGMLAPPPKLPLNDSSKRGREIFERLRCAVCHTPALATAPIVKLPHPASSLPTLRYFEVAALENQTAELYSDLLLHQMGPGLADGIVDVTAGGGEWRTTPLWGLRLRKWYLHDGRAKTIDAAIRAHGGQAEPVKQAYIALPEKERADLEQFLRSI
jgi:CxxC motif-containing protein (DUF1111 family)